MSSRYFKVIDYNEKGKEFISEMKKINYIIRVFPFRYKGINRPKVRKIEIQYSGGSLQDRLKVEKQHRELLNKYKKIFFLI